MAHPQFDWSVTLEEGGILLFEGPVRVTASVHDNGEVFITDLELINRHKGKHEKGRNWPFLDNVDGRISGLAELAKETLEADDDFRAKAHSEAGLICVSRGFGDPEAHFKWEAA